MSIDCKFCVLAASAEATRVGSVYIIDDGYPVTPGHTLIIPLRHCSDFFDLTADELRDTQRASLRVREELGRSGVDGFNIGWNCGEAAGQTIGHAHCHLIPRRAGDMTDPTGGVRGVIPEMQKYSTNTRAAFHGIVR